MTLSETSHNHTVPQLAKADLGKRVQVVIIVCMCTSTIKEKHDDCSLMKCGMHSKSSLHL